MASLTKRIDGNVLVVELARAEQGNALNLELQQQLAQTWQALDEADNLRVYWVDPGDMRTQMHQEAFPGEDISDRPLPEASVPGLLELLVGDHPSGRYKVRELQRVAA